VTLGLLSAGCGRASTGRFDCNWWWTNSSWYTASATTDSEDEKKDKFKDCRATRWAQFEVSEYHSPVATFFAGRQASHDLVILRELKHLGTRHP
jgi:hypothetical protein